MWWSLRFLRFSVAKKTTMAHKCHIRYYFHRSSDFQNLSYYYLMPQAIINTIHVHYLTNLYYYPHAIINNLMLLSTNSCWLSAKPILLSDNSYSDTSTTHNVIIKHIMLLLDTSCFIKQSMLLLNSLCYYQHLNLLPLHFISYLFHGAVLAHRGATGRAFQVTLLLPQVILFSRYFIILSTTSCYYKTPMILSNKSYY